jgi:hypothetical protein
MLVVFVRLRETREEAEDAVRRRCAGDGALAVEALAVEGPTPEPEPR